MFVLHKYCSVAAGQIRIRPVVLREAYLSFPVLVVPLHGQLLQDSQQMQSLLRLECEEVQVHQQEAHRQRKLLCWDK